MPTFELQGADGSIYEADAPDEASAVAAFKKMQGAGPGVADTAKDVAKSAGIGMVKGGIGLAGLPGDLAEFGARGINAAVQGVGKLTGLDVGPSRAPQAPTYGSQDIRAGLEGVTGPLYTPKTTAGEYAQTGGEFAAGLVGGGGAGALARRALTNVVAPAVTSETAGQLSKGTAAEPYARLGGALLGGAAGGLAGSATRIEAPTRDALKASAKGAYQSPEVTALQIDPNAAHKLVTGIKADLAKQIDNEVIKGTLSTLSKEETAWAPNAAKPNYTAALTGPSPAPAAKAPVAVSEIDDLRQRLGGLLSSPEPKERMAASIARHKIDDFLDNLTQQQVVAGDAAAAVPTLRGARADYGAQARAGVVDTKALQAELRSDAAASGLNIGNSTRQRMVDVFMNPKMQAGWNQAEKDQLRRVIEGTTPGNAMREVGNTLGGGGGIAGPFAAAMGGATLGPAGFGLPIVGRIARGLSNRSTLNQTEKLNEMLRNRSALGPQEVPLSTSERMSPALAAALLEANSSPLRITVNPSDRVKQYR